MSLIGQLARQLIGPWGRRAFLVLAVGAAWAAWAVLPPWPIRAWAATFGEADISCASPDGEFLLTAVDTSRGWETGPPPDWKVDVWNANAVKGLTPADLYYHQFGPGGLLVVADQAGVITVRKSADGKVLLTTPPGREQWGVLTDGRNLACFLRGAPQTVEIWNISSGKSTATLTGVIAPLALSPDGKLLATGCPSLGAAICVWDKATGGRLADLGGKNVATPIQLAFSPDGSRLAAFPGVIDKNGVPRDLTLWDVGAAKPSVILSCPYVQVGCGIVTFSPDGRLLVFRSRSKSHIWDLTFDPPLSIDQMLDGAKSSPEVPFDAAAYPMFTPDGTRCIVPGLAEDARSWLVYDARTLKPVADCVAPRKSSWFQPISISPDSRLLAVTVLPNQEPPRPWEAWLERQLGYRLPWRRIGPYIQVYDLASGAESGQAPRGETLIGFAPDSQSLWSYSTPTIDGQSEIQVRQWAVPSSWPPFWLLAVTAAAILFAVFDWRRSRRRVAGAMP